MSGKNRTRAKHVADDETQRMLRHWREVVPNDRLAHLVKDAFRAFDRSLQARLAEHGVPLGHWRFLRALWETDGLTQRELSREAGVMEPTTFAALTAKGRALERKLVPLAKEINRLAVAGVPARDVAATRRTLLVVLANLARDELQF
jgi:MarR family transcriptional regulator, organic hydroperoxide resistance regulator